MDYRSFLRDYLKAKPHFSLTQLGRKSGGISKAHLSLIASGKRNIASKRIHQLGSSLDLSAKEMHYFENLVRFNQAKSSPEKQFHLDKLMDAHPERRGKSLEQSQYAILKNWHALVIRELVRLPGFDATPSAIAKRCRNRMSPAEAKAALEALVHAELVTITDDGKYLATSETLRTSDEIKSTLIQSYHASCLDLAKESLQNDTVDSREFSSINVALTSEQFEIIKNKLKEFRDGVIPKNTGHGDKNVYQLNMQLFAMTEEGKKR